MASISLNRNESLKPQRLHELFEAQVVRSSNRPAIYFQGEEDLPSFWTYDELNWKADNLSGAIANHPHLDFAIADGGQPIVAILLQHRHQVVLASLAALKSSTVYVPLSVAYPVQHIQRTLTDAGSPLLLTTREILERLGLDWNNCIFIEDEDEQKTGKLSLDSKNGLACIIYTSGTTGISKGVMIEETAIRNLVQWQISKYELDQDDRASLFYSAAFDVCLLETWPCLLTGGSLHVVPNHIRFDPEALLKWTLKRKITLIDLPTAVANSFVKLFMDGHKSHLRYLTIGGEKATEFYPAGLPFRVVNAYGPTEATVQATTFLMEELTVSRSRPPIGKPVDGTLIYIWDGMADKPFGIGTTGEIWIGGVGLARGYHNRRELTLEKFIPNPFLKDGSKIYRTGDMGRWLSCGNLEFLGRIDDQVKIRGFRIQLNEIEHILEQNGLISSAAVVVRESDLLGKQLVAFIVPKGGTPGDVLRLIRMDCVNNFPPYMIPSLWSTLPRLPLTPNGKVDRVLLSKLAEDLNLELGDDFIPPVSELEMKVGGIWARVLNIPVDRVGLQDDFFVLGGHSLLVMKVVQLIREEMKIPNLRPIDLLKNLCLGDFVQQLEYIMDKEEEVIVEESHSSDSTFPLSFAQQLIWLHMEKAGDSEMYNEMDWINIPGGVNIQALGSAVNLILERHEALRAFFPLQVDGRPVQRFRHHENQTLVVRTFSTGEEEAVEGWAQEEFRKPMSLALDPLARFLLAVTPNKSTLIVIAHHLVMDGVSLAQIIFPELSTLYQAFTSGKEKTSLAPLKHNFRDYLMRQHQENSRHSVEFLKSKLRSGIPLNFPVDGGDSSSDSCRSISISVGEETVKSLKDICRSSGSTLYIGLLTTVNILLQRLTHQDDITICGISAGRDDPKSEKLVGHFTNFLVFQNQVSSEKTFFKLLDSVTRNCKEVYQHQDVPYVKILAELPLMDRILSSVVFSMELEPPDNQLGWTLQQLNQVGNATSKFNLTIRVEQLEGHLTTLFQFNPRIFKESRIRRLAKDFQEILEQVSGNPEKCVGDFNNGDGFGLGELLDYPKDKTLHELFREQVKKTPGAPAIEGENGVRLSYRELDERSDNLAGILNHVKEAFVVIILPQSVEFMVSVLAVMKSGMAFIPLDEDTPLDRIQFILNDSKCKVVISNEPVLEKSKLILSDDVQLVNLTHNAASSIPSHPRSLVPCEPNSLAYVIYTSGSTGEPKGVMIEHLSLVSFCYWNITYSELSPQDRSALLAAPNFDACILESFPYLLSGGRLVIPLPETKYYPQKLLQWLETRRITIAFLTTALAEPFIRQDFSGSNLSLRKLYTGGDTLSLYPPEDLPFDLINVYGTTETTILATEINLRGYKPSSPTPPIGKPISNLTLQILDPKMRKAGVGVIGELWISGEGLGRGYLNRGELTREKYRIQNGVRMYRSGDLACWLEDGNIHFQGRIDDQVKIRGCRVELGEIQARLEELPGVQRATLTVESGRGGGNKYIRAYVQPSRDEGDVSTQQEMFEEIYREIDYQPKASILGWTDSFTGSEIPQEEMSEWVLEATEKILELRPRNILEIGCGTGLLLDEICGVDHVESYTATDFSSHAINSLRRRLNHPLNKVLREKTRITHRAADIYEEEEFGKYDMIIINSVIQYFPNLAYLEKVIGGALKCLQEGGHLFLGDVRDLRLLKAFHGSRVAVTRSKLTVTQWRQKMEREVQSEEELVIHPHFFQEIVDRNENLSHVTVTLKRGRGDNEMNCYRYDVILHSHAEAPEDQSCAVVAFPGMGDLKKALGSLNSPAICIKEIPHRRVFKYVHACSTAGGDLDLQSVLDGIETPMVDQEEIFVAGESLGYFVRLIPSSKTECFDAIFTRERSPCSILESVRATTATTTLANTPSLFRKHEELKCSLKSHLKSKLPSYCIPSSWTFLDDFPLTTNGKVDKKALSKLTVCEDKLNLNFTAPLTPIEIRMSELWSDILNIPSTNISLHDDFFELGGNSILAAQLIKAIRLEFGIKLSLKSLFEKPQLQDISGSLVAPTDTEDGNIVVLRSTGERSPPLFLIHSVRGTVFCYRELYQEISGRDIYAIQSTHQYSSIQATASAYIQMIRKIHPTEPVALGGHCFGGLVAFEMANQMGADVEFLVLLDSYPVERRELEEFRNLGGKWNAIAEKRVEIAIAWEPPRVDTPVVAIKPQGEFFNWQTCCGKPVREYTVGGDHESMLCKPHVQVIGRIISQVL